ncbi:YjbH domain-containing protein [Orenia marismortui]|uniref:YjbH domain-containing protein n=1 Tax=Orenia marismortui TaxID=46469 RepID=UPI000363307C|nr:YjbH domain-containing protein [Orenia marismortui]
MKAKLIVFLLVSVLLVPSIVNAGSLGANSLITIPTADTLDSSELNLNYQHFDSLDFVLTSYGLREGVELGAAVISIDGADDDNEVYPMVKVNLFKENNNYQPEVSLGVIDDSLYLVASKSISPYGFRAHVGIADDNEITDKAFVGLSKVLNPVSISTGDNEISIPTTTLMAEYNDQLNLGVDFAFSSGVSVNLGVLDMDDFTFGLGFKNRF